MQKEKEVEQKKQNDIVFPLIGKAFRTGEMRKEEERAWAKTLEKLDHNDLLLLWLSIPFSHPLHEPNSFLLSFFLHRIEEEGGFTTSKVTKFRE